MEEKKWKRAYSTEILQMEKLRLQIAGGKGIEEDPDNLCCSKKNSKCNQNYVPDNETREFLY